MNRFDCLPALSAWAWLAVVVLSLSGCKADDYQLTLTLSSPPDIDPVLVTIRASCQDRPDTLCVVLTSEAGHVDCPGSECSEGSPVKKVGIPLPSRGEFTSYAVYHPAAMAGRDLLVGRLYRSATCPPSGSPVFLAADSLHVSTAPDAGVAADGDGSSLRDMEGLSPSADIASGDLATPDMTVVDLGQRDR